MKKVLSNFIRALLVFLIVAGALMCFWWLPQAVEYAASHFAEYAVAETVAYILCAVIVLPLFAVFGVSFVFPRAIEKDTMFSIGTAKLLKWIGMTLIIDCVLFCMMIFVLLLAGEVILAPALLFVGALGITVGAMLSVLSKFVSRAAALKEEADYTL